MNPELKAALDRSFDRIQQLLSDRIIWTDLVATYSKKGNAGLQQSSMNRLTQVEIDLHQENANYQHLLSQWNAPVQSARKPSEQPSTFARLFT